MIFFCLGFNTVGVKTKNYETLIFVGFPYKHLRISNKLFQINYQILWFTKADRDLNLLLPPIVCGETHLISTVLFQLLTLFF